MDSGNPTDVDKLNPRWQYEPFTVVADGGIGEVAFYSTYHKRFWRMAGSDMVRSDILDMDGLGPPPEHSWLRFKPKLVMSKADADKAAAEAAAKAAAEAKAKAEAEAKAKAEAEAKAKAEAEAKAKAAAEAKAKAEAEAKAKAEAEAAAAAEFEYAMFKEGSCEDHGMITITDEDTCQNAGAAIDNQPDKIVKVIEGSIDRPKGCTLHPWQMGSAQKPAEFFRNGRLDGCGKYGYQCLCISKVKAKVKADVNPFADSAALRTAVDNCLRAVPSGLDCCKPKSEGGGGADCGAGGHAAIGDWDVSQVTSMDDLFHGQKVGKEFNQDISKWDVSKVTNMQYMFFHSAFDQDITGWNTASLPNDRASYRMFTGDGPWYQKYGRVGWSGFGDMNGPPSAWHIKAKAAGT